MWEKKENDTKSLISIFKSQVKMSDADSARSRLSFVTTTKHT